MSRFFRIRASGLSVQDVGLGNLGLEVWLNGLGSVGVEDLGFRSSSVSFLKCCKCLRSLAGGCQ